MDFLEGAEDAEAPDKMSKGKVFTYLPIERDKTGYEKWNCLLNQCKTLLSKMFMKW